MVEVLAKEFFDVWVEAKSELPVGDNWNDITWEKLTQKHQGEYLKTARRNLSLLSASYEAKKNKAVEEVRNEIINTVDGMLESMGLGEDNFPSSWWKSWQALKAKEGK
jgi:hypothetical protein